MLRKSDGLRCSDNYLDGLIKNANSLSASRRRLKAGEITLTLEVCGCKLSLQTLLYQTYNMQDEMKIFSKDSVSSEIPWYKNTCVSFWFLNVEKCWYCGGLAQIKHIPQHNNLSTTSLLITLTVFVAGATNSPIYKHRPEVNFGPGACARWNRLTVSHRSEYTPHIIVNILLYLFMWQHWRNDTLLQCKVVSGNLLTAYAIFM